MTKSSRRRNDNGSRSRSWNLDARSRMKKASKRKVQKEPSPRPPEVDTSKRRGSDFRLSDSEHVSPVRGRELSGIRTGRFSVVEEGYDWMLRQLNLPLSVSPVKTTKKTFKSSSVVNPIPEDDLYQQNTTDRKKSFRQTLSGR